MTERSGGGLDSRQVLPGGQVILLCCTPTPKGSKKPRLDWIGPKGQSVSHLAGVNQKVFVFPDREPGRTQLILVIKV